MRAAAQDLGNGQYHTPLSTPVSVVNTEYMIASQQMYIKHSPMMAMRRAALGLALGLAHGAHGQNFTVISPQSGARIPTSAPRLPPSLALCFNARWVTSGVCRALTCQLPAAVHAAGFQVQYILPPGGAVNGSFTMSWAAVSGAADPYSPHVVTFANETSAGG